MRNHRVVKGDSVSTLERDNKNGEFDKTLVTVITSTSTRVAVIEEKYFKGLRFKGANLVHRTVNGNRIIEFAKNTELDVYMLPNHMHYHNEIMQANRSMLHLSTASFIQPVQRDSMQLDYDGILNNMLEFIGRM